MKVWGIDFKKKMITATREAVDKRTASIKQMARFDGKLILEGMGDELAWSVAISEQTGKMVITASGERVGLVVFGACTPLYAPWLKNKRGSSKKIDFPCRLPEERQLKPTVCHHNYAELAQISSGPACAVRLSR